MAVFEVELLHPGAVTVIIPAYNGERFIRRAIDSVLQQTYPVTQIIVIDDGSTDATRAIVSEYTDRVTLIEQRNGGPAKARNAGLSAATGEFIAFLDADDWWEPVKIETQLSVLKVHPEAIGNYTGLRVVSDAGEFLVDLKPVEHTNLR